MRPPIPADHHSVRTVFAFIAGLQAVCFALVYQLTGVAALIVPVALILAVFGRTPINDVLAGRITKSEQRIPAPRLQHLQPPDAGL